MMGSSLLAKEWSIYAPVATSFPVRQVTISRAFAVGKFEITWADWDSCVAGGGCRTRLVPKPNSDLRRGTARHPAIVISWNDAKAYTAWLAETTQKPYRLLSESEWEYAARSGLKKPEEFAKLTQLETDRKVTMPKHQPEPVGTRTANSFGIHDLLGNVQEWVEDCFNLGPGGWPADNKARTKPDCRLRVLRGGSFMLGSQVGFINFRNFLPVLEDADVSEHNLRAAFGNSRGASIRGAPDTSLSDIGFRVARDLD